MREIIDYVVAQWQAFTATRRKHCARDEVVLTFEFTRMRYPFPDMSCYPRLTLIRTNILFPSTERSQSCPVIPTTPPLPPANLLRTSLCLTPGFTSLSKQLPRNPIRQAQNSRTDSRAIPPILAFPPASCNPLYEVPQATLGLNATTTSITRRRPFRRKS